MRHFLTQASKRAILATGFLLRYGEDLATEVLSLGLDHMELGYDFSPGLACGVKAMVDKGDVHISSMDSSAENFDDYNFNRYLRTKRIIGEKSGLSPEILNIY